jgi:drug/metabolite transporter (DMT)-like permease
VEISRTRLLLNLVLGIVAISFAAVLIRLAQAQGVPTIAIAAWRLIFASLVLLPYAWARRREEIRSLTRRETGLLAASGLFLGLHFAAWIASFSYTSVASSVVLVSMGPVFVGVGSWLFLHERPGPKMFAGILLAAVGSIIVSWGDFDQGQSHLLGDLLALTGAVMAAAYLMIGRTVRGHLSLATYAGLVYGGAMVTLIIIVLATGQPMFGFNLQAYVWLLALGMVPQLIGHSTLNWALRYLSATFVAIVTLSEPIGSVILAYIILGEAVTWNSAVGGAVVLTGIYISSRAEMSGPRSKTLSMENLP